MNKPIVKRIEGGRGWDTFWAANHVVQTSFYNDSYVDAHSRRLILVTTRETNGATSWVTRWATEDVIKEFVE
jgi:hypothetical protein